VHRVRAGRPTTPVRRAGNAVYVVYQGTGSSVIDGQRFEWGPGDMFAVPSWCPVEHHVDGAAAEQADLFVLTDAPVLRALGIYREETLSAPQAVTGTFTPRTLENS
jgi:gentisate 1,2-dioxygenase